jgi:NADH dehydrogenase
VEGKHQIVIIGGGFGGLRVALRLKHAPAQVTLIDRRNFHLFQPLLYQVAVGGLSPANIASPLRALLKRQANTRVLLGEVTDIEAPARRVLFSGGEAHYDTLVVATGSSHHYFGHDEWKRLAPGLKTVEDATDIRRRVLLAFEAAEEESDPKERSAWLTFVIVGGGPTGVELAGAVAELARHTLRSNFRTFDPASAQVLLLEGTDRVLPPYPAKLSAKAAAQLARLGVTVRTDAVVTDVRPGAVTVRCSGLTQEIPTRTVLWAAGVRASPLGRVLAMATGAEVDRAGRVRVGPDLSLPGHPELLVIGDLALCPGPDGKPLPGVAPVAIQQGAYVARLIRSRLEGRAQGPFRYRDRGTLATIGRSAAVADFHWIWLSGFLAWLAWLFIHLLFLVEFENRVLVLLQWGWNYFTRNRSARLITGASPFPLRGGKAGPP